MESKARGNPTLRKSAGGARVRAGEAGQKDGGRGPMARIESIDALRRLYKQPSERVRRKQLDRLDDYCRRYIALSPFVLVASSGADGLADVSPRGERPGFVQVLDERRLAIPDRPGNNRLDSMTNLLANPAIGLLFMVPGFQETLRVNGVAEIRDDDDLRARFAVGGRLPATVILVSVREAYFHCAKSIMRARLWEPEARADRGLLPTLGQMIKEQAGLAAPVEDEAEVLARYRETLY